MKITARQTKRFVMLVLFGLASGLICVMCKLDVHSAAIGAALGAVSVSAVEEFWPRAAPPPAPAAPHEGEM